MNRSNELTQLQRIAKGIATRASDLLQAPHRTQNNTACAEKKPPLHLAHYTSLEALISLLQNPHDGLRLADSTAMNDPEEGESTVDDRIFLHLLDSEFGQGSWVNRRYRSANICCFVGIKDEDERTIDAGDDLLYWRLYGNDCRGVSITIAPHVSTSLAASSLVQQVIYTDEPPLQLDVASVAALLHDLDGLRARARDAEIWSRICGDVLPDCDRLFANRFLHKRSHYEMGHEYRSVVFDTQDDADDEDRLRISSRGMHVQYGLVRRYVRIPELSCESILTTNSQITIGSNVRDGHEARKALSSLLVAGGSAPNVVSIRVSEIPYRAR